MRHGMEWKFREVCLKGLFVSMAPASDVSPPQRSLSSLHKRGGGIVWPEICGLNTPSVVRQTSSL